MQPGGVSFGRRCFGRCARSDIERVGPGCSTTHIRVPTARCRILAFGLLIRLGTTGDTRLAAAVVLTHALADLIALT